MQIFSLDIHPISYQDILEDIVNLQSPQTVFTPNPEILLQARKDIEFLKILKQASYLTNDGIGLYLGYQIQDNPYGRWKNLWYFPYYIFNIFFRRPYLYEKYGERISGSDLTLDLLKISEQKHIHISIIDLYTPNDPKKNKFQDIFSQKLKEQYPKLTFHYYVYDPKKKHIIHKDIKNSSSRILFSTLGMKLQEQSVIEIMKACPNIKLGIGVGSSFDYITGFQKRAPKMMRDIGIEWMYRLITSPNKLKRLKRVYQAVIVFPFVVLLDKETEKN